MLSHGLKSGRELGYRWRVDLDMLGLERVHKKEKSL
jgi:hypothetical protein